MSSSEISHSSSLALIGSLQVIVASISWGTLGIFTTYLHQLGFDSVQIAILRIVTSAVILLSLLPSLWSTLKQLTPVEIIQMAVQSLVGVLGMTLSYFMAVNYVGAGIAVSLLYMAPVFSLGLAYVLLKEQITTKALILAVVAVLGVMLTMMGNTVKFNWGIVFGLLAGLFYSLFGILGKKMMHKNYPSNLVFFSSVMISAMVLLCLPKTYHTYAMLLNMPIKTWLWVLGLTFLGTIIPFFLYMSALHKLPATKVSVFTVFEPFTAIVLSIVLLHQNLNATQYVGMGLILFATLANAMPAKNNAKT
ncbi:MULTISPECIES: DMT family transporter [unclassified Moraxella]|uniref:DMT family transporter n=1 Tax=unclassified Moraxella TaxID=2685852 RepID=UPI003AF64DD6